MITRKQKIKQIENIERNKIGGWYHLEELKKQVKKGDDTIQVLFNLLQKEINRHNGVIAKKSNKIRNTPTVD